MGSRFDALSAAQRERFREMSGQDWDGEALQGSFATRRPFDQPWSLSPWTFTYLFYPETGYLFCELTHRMTNNRTSGWDVDGNALPSKLVDAVFPPHF